MKSHERGHLGTLRGTPNTRHKHAHPELLNAHCHSGGHSLTARKNYDVVVVDPDDAVRDGIRILLGSFGVRVYSYRDARSFLDDPREISHGCVLLESELPDRSGLDLLKEIKRNGTNAPVVLMTSSSNSRFVDLAITTGADAVLTKPLDSEHLLDQLESILNSNYNRPPPEKD